MPEPMLTFLLFPCLEQNSLQTQHVNRMHTLKRQHKHWPYGLAAGIWLWSRHKQISWPYYWQEFLDPWMCDAMLTQVERREIWKLTFQRLRENKIRRVKETWQESRKREWKRVCGSELPNNFRWIWQFLMSTQTPTLANRKVSSRQFSANKI